MFDTHAHLNFSAFKDDADKVIRRSLDGNVWLINVGTQYSTGCRALEIAEKYPEGAYAAIGLHPIHLETGLIKIKVDPEEIEFNTREEEFDYEKYKKLARSPKVVAIGEIGLDYYWKPKTKKKLELFKEKQKKVLLRQLELARELDLPVIFHCRIAHNDLIHLLCSFYRDPTPVNLSLQGSGLCKLNCKLNGVIHCFTGTWEQAQEYMNMGLYLGFNGLIFKLNFDEIIRKTPLEKILIETDCPYLTPPQASGRNEPLNVKYIVQKIAELKNESCEKIEEVATQNAKNLFKIT